MVFTFGLSKRWSSITGSTRLENEKKYLIYNFLFFFEDDLIITKAVRGEFFLDYQSEIFFLLLCFQSFVACALGIENIGYVMICYGVTDAVCSLSFGRLVQFVGHIPFFALGKNFSLLLI